MKNLKILSAAFLLAAAGARPVKAAQTSAGADAFDFLLFDANARAVALGGAYTALATDSNALLYNPAGLGAVRRSEATFMHNQYIQGLTQEYAAMASRHGWGVNLNYLNFGGLDRATYARPNGTGGTTGMSDLALAGGYGRSFGPLALGGAVKVLQERIDDVTANGFAVDGGALYSVEQVNGLTLGLSLLNVGPDVKSGQFKQRLPTQLRAGASYALAALGAQHTFAVDASRGRTDKARVGVGAESVIGRMMALRVGFSTRYDAGIGITGGAGWLWNDLSLDYAIVPFDTLGIAHRVSVTFRWGDASAKNGN